MKPPKIGPRERRRLLIEAEARDEEECDKFVRSHMTPELVSNTKRAIEAFNTEDRGSPVRRK